MEAARAVFPDIIKGIYGDDEMQSVVESAPQNDTKAGTLNQILGGKPEPKDVIAEVEDPKPQGMTDEEKAQFADTFGPAEGEDQAGPDPEEFVLGFGRNKGTKLRALSDEDIVALQKWIAETARKPLNETNKKHLEAVGAVIRKRNIA